MIAAAAILLVWTVAMLGVHLRSRRLVEHIWRPERKRMAWLKVTSLVRFEGLYYIAAVAYAAVARQRVLWVVIAVMAVIHWGVWASVERQPERQVAGPQREQFLRRIQLFDWGESLALVYILWQLAGALR